MNKPPIPFSATLVRFSNKEQMFFAKRLSFLVKAGIPLLECLYLIRSQSKSKAKSYVYDSVIADVAGGQYLSSSLSKFKRLFSAFSINLILVGEKSGILSQNLAYLADELQKKHELQKKVIGALVYPVFITVATLGVTGVLTVYIFPKLMPLFRSLHVVLPLSTRVLIATSAYLERWGIVSVLTIVVSLVLVVYIRSCSLRLQLLGDALLLRIPLVGGITRAYNLANFCRTLGLLLRSGIPLTDALGITADSTTNKVYQLSCRRMSIVATRGGSVAKCLADRPLLYPDILTNLVTIGEKTGNLSNTLTYLGEMYEGEVDELTKALSNSVEPILMICMGLLVGIIAVSVITPIYSITQQLQTH